MNNNTNDYKQYQEYADKLEHRHDINDYKQEALDNEYEFRLILNVFDEAYKGRLRHNTKSVQQIFESFSTGNRNGKFTIVDFFKIKEEENTFFFASHDMAMLSGGGSISIYKVENDKASRIKLLSGWRC